MEDASKAIVMIGQVFMFVLAATFAIFLYNKLDANLDNVIIASNYNNRGDSIVNNNEVNTKRVVTRDEIIISILNLELNPDMKVKVGSDTYSFSTTKNQIQYKAGNGSANYYDLNSINLRDLLFNNVTDVNYYLSSTTDKTLKYVSY